MKNHTFKLGRYRFCIGCFIGYPSAIIGLGVAIFLYLKYGLALSQLLSIGAMGYSSIFIYLSKYSENKRLKMIQKASLGIGSGFLLAFGFFALETVQVIRFLVTASLALGFILPVRTFHLAKMSKICRVCAQKGKDSACAF